MSKRSVSSRLRYDNNVNYNLPTELFNIGYRLHRVLRGFVLVDRNGNIVGEWYKMPSLTELFDLAKTL